MNTNEVFGDGSAAVDLWRRLLEAEIELEEAEDSPDVFEELDDVDEDELAAAQTTVFARLGIGEPDGRDALVAAFMVDLENWRTDASASPLALARDVGSLAATVKVSVPDLRSEGLNEVVQFECDLDESGRISELAVKVSEAGEALPLTITLIEPNGAAHTARVSSFGLARFSRLAIEPTAGTSLRFELRRQRQT
jgi:hypothetical protein